MRLLYPPAIAGCVGASSIVVLMALFGAPAELPTPMAVGAVAGLCLVLILAYLAVIAALDRRLLTMLFGRLARRS